MTNASTTPKTDEAKSAEAQDPQRAPKPADMSQADTANGENPDMDNHSSAATPTAHPTGERQARENLENDPPA